MRRPAIAAYTLAVGILSTLGALFAISATEYAPQMPLAPRSLLLDFSPAGDRLLVAGERGHILYSDDGGDNWQQARVPTTQMLTALHFADASRGWAVGHDGLVLFSEDGGATWRVQRDGLAAQQQANLEARELAYRTVRQLETALAESGEDQRADLELQLEDAVFDLEDADLALEEPLFTSPLMDVWFQDQERGWAVGAFGAFLETRNGGQTWTSVAGEIDNPDEFHLNAVTGDGRGRVFIAGEGGMMFRSLDGGDSWETLEPFYEGSWFGSLFNVTSDHLLVYGLRGNVYHSADFGLNWEPAASDSNVSLAGGAVRDDGTIALVGGVGTLLVSEDGGRQFQVIRLADRLSLAAVWFAGDRLVLAGQGGVKVADLEALGD